MNGPTFLNSRNFPAGMRNRLESPPDSDKLAIDRRAAPFDPTCSADQAQFKALSESWNENMSPLGDVIEGLNATNIPPQLRQVFYAVTLTGVVPQLLIPMNPFRMSFIISPGNTTGNILFTYGFPQMRAGNAGNNFVGIPMGTFFQETNGTVSIDDIWVFASDNTASQLVIGFEGSLAIEGHANG